MWIWVEFVFVFFFVITIWLSCALQVLSGKKRFRFSSNSSEIRCLCSRFAIFHVYFFFRFTFRVTLLFPYECPGLRQHRPGQS